MKEKVAKEFFNVLDIKPTDIAFDNISYNDLINAAMSKSMSEYLNYKTDILAVRLRKLFPEKDNLQRWNIYLISLTTYKKCVRCNKVHKLELFNKLSTSLDGYQYSCKICANHYSKIHQDEKNIKAKYYYQKNKEKISNKNKQYYLNHKLESLVKMNKRRANKLQATPAWYEKDLVTEIYKQSSMETHIDHIIPLQSSVVCGLHCIDNLQAISAKENLEKSNKFEQDFESMEHMEWLLNHGLAL